MAGKPIVSDAPLHIIFRIPTPGFGNGLIVIKIESVLLQPVAVAVSVKKYFVVETGLTFGFDKVVTHST